ncbi:tetratricopeptide repeat protein [Jiulongibacter sp. NS-SX5]|uniref:tetratricopeptide repeat protein n=1 Tax=Jiulongibacter sp. NS-SX5 TaxID=3463854 RepID=UPI004058788C
MYFKLLRFGFLVSALLFSAVFHAGFAVAQGTDNPTLSPEKREAYIQKANSLRAEEKYVEAIAQLDSILIVNPEDAGILLYKGDLSLQAGKYGQAVDVYGKLIPLDYEKTTVMVNQSYALFMNKKASKALGVAREAWLQDSEKKNATVNYFNAMLWNTKTGPASKFLDEQKKNLGEDDKLVLMARLKTTSGDYRNGLRFYERLARSFPNKNYLNEYFEVFIAKGKKDQIADKILAKKEILGESSTNALLGKLNDFKKKNAGTSFSYFNDIGGNSRVTNAYWFQTGTYGTYSLKAGGGFSTLSSEFQGNIKTSFFDAQLAENWSRLFSGKTEFRYQSVNPENAMAFGGVTGKQSFTYLPNDRRMLSLFASKDILNFTPELYSQNINSTSVGYVAHVMLDGKTGIYGQGNRGWYSDENKKVEAFTSLYHIFALFPVIKAGINYSYLHFDKQVTAYFAPNRYSNAELFADITGKLPTKFPLSFNLQGGLGLQQIETNAAEPAARYQVELKTGKSNLTGSLKYQTSNVASSTGAGYKFDWFTLTLGYRW